MDQLEEIKQLISRLNAGLEYLDKAKTDDDVERGLKQFKKLSEELAQLTDKYQAIHGKINWDNPDGYYQSEQLTIGGKL